MYFKSIVHNFLLLGVHCKVVFFNVPDRIPRSIQTSLAYAFQSEYLLNCYFYKLFFNPKFSLILIAC